MLRPARLLVAVLVVLSPAPACASDWIAIAAGAFTMGRDGGPADEAPAHRVRLPAFRIQARKVTNREFAAYLERAGLTGPDGRRYDDDDADARIHRRGGRWVADAGFADHPAVEVSWFGARDYCAALGARLPSEAEWERAARSTDGRAYPWGAAPPSLERAVFGRAYNETAPGDGRPAGRSAEGVEDLLGNLREWTSSALMPYPWTAKAFTGAERVVVRGASHDDPAESLSVTRRHAYERRGAAAGHHHVGFRCAKDH
ncbi:MAG TPA: SUMF1/EgtB/PvdO family nonheme iron enzyme [Terriglobales bacterium]|nr:SUMF1/EgtB/PvdO family nonheme iron enzyme [Terriglobales bacterium]